MTTQTFKEWLLLNGVDEHDSQIITAPCCKRRKPIFSMLDRDLTDDNKESANGFLCDSCAVEKVREVQSLLLSLSSLFNPNEDWKLVRYERDLRLDQTDRYEMPGVRRKLTEEQLEKIDEYRDWLRDITDIFDDPRTALKEVCSRPMPLGRE